MVVCVVNVWFYVGLNVWFYEQENVFMLCCMQLCIYLVIYVCRDVYKTLEHNISQLIRQFEWKYYSQNELNSPTRKIRADLDLKDNEIILIKDIQSF